MRARTYAAAVQLVSDAARHLELKDGDASESECKTFATDNPSVVIVVRDASGLKRIDHYLGCHGVSVHSATS
jgi:hypothetical protein